MVDIQLFDIDRADSIVFLEAPHIPRGLGANGKQTDLRNRNTIVQPRPEPVASGNVPHVLNPVRVSESKRSSITISVIRHLPANLAARTDVARVQQANEVTLVAHTISRIPKMLEASQPMGGCFSRLLK